MKPPLLTDLIELWNDWRRAARNQNRSGWDHPQTNRHRLSKLVQKHKTRKGKLR